MGIWPLIKDYSHRELTFPRDYLNAFLGILRFYEQEPFQVRHYWGIPIVPTKDERRFTGGFLYGLDKDLPDEPEQREGFPSWS
jgi:hypothetical protein